MQLQRSGVYQVGQVLPGRGNAVRTFNAVKSRVSSRRSLQVQARVESEILEAGFKAPDFTLPEPLTGKQVTLSEYTAGKKATLIMVICNLCPFVVHLKPAIVALAAEYQPKGVSFVAISSNSAALKPKDR